MHRQLILWSKQLNDYKIPRWEELPDFDLYSDQVIQLIKGYLNLFDQKEESIITGAMINNYVKHKMMPKPEKKKYQKVHIAYLIAISLLKQVLTIQEINDGITYQAEASGLKGAYNLFCDEMERALQNVALQIQGRVKETNYIVPRENQAMYFASTAFTSKIVAEKIVEINKLEREETDDVE